MGKRLMLKLSRVLPFQLCRSRHHDPSTFAENPRPRSGSTVYRQSPVNLKAVDIPSPPPSTPVTVASVGCSWRGRPHRHQEMKKATKVRISEEAVEMLISPTSRSFSDDSSFELPSMESSRRRIKKMRRGGTWKGNKAMGGVAVVKKTSEDPCEDFKRSMLEMILEKEMFEAEELEELLKCFLSLNSRNYHDVIVEAFTEIWEQLFCGSPDPYTNTNTNTNTKLP